MKKILLVEDHPDIRENTASILQMAGYEVYTAENGMDGIDEARRAMPDLIVCDVMMPVLDGFGMLHMLQKDPRFQNIPFIFLTAKSDRADQRKGMEMGADDFLSKPFEITELLSAVETRLTKLANAHAKGTFSRKIGDKEKKEWIRNLFAIPQVKRFSVKKKSTISQEGNLAQQLVLVEKGIVKSCCVHNLSKVLITELHFKGDIIGLSDLLVNQTYTTSSEAVTDAELAVVSQNDLEEYFKQYPKEADMVVHFLGNEIMQKQAQLLDMAYTPMRDRVEYLIKDLETRLDQNNLDGVSTYFTREELAQMAGTATESLIRVLGGKQ